MCPSRTVQNQSFQYMASAWRWLRPPMLVATLIASGLAEILQGWTGSALPWNMEQSKNISKPGPDGQEKPDREADYRSKAACSRME